MSYPTVLAPWYVVQQMRTLGMAGEMLYYRTDEEGKTVWTDNPHEAMLFMSLHSAARVAGATAGHVRVLTTKDDLAEFRAKEEVV